MKRVKSLVLIPFLTVLLICFSTTAFADSSSEETSTSSVTLNTVTLGEHSSYVTGSYFGVINVEVADTNVAAATSDSQGRVVITAIGIGTTRVHFWFKSDAFSGWTKATVPVTVSSAVTASSSSTSESTQVGLIFPQSSVSIAEGGDYTLSNIMLNGGNVNASSLLWVSSSSAVAAVDSTTGKITAVEAGTAVVYAIDPTSQAVASLKVTVD